jgi:hypothetical protein
MSTPADVLARAEALGAMDHATLVLHALGIERQRDSLASELRTEAAKLRHWAVQSRTGGCSTHQVEAMRQRANEIDDLLSKHPTSDNKPLTMHIPGVGERKVTPE